MRIAFKIHNEKHRRTAKNENYLKRRIAKFCNEYSIQPELITVQIGWVNADFVKNKFTVLISTKDV